MIFNSSSRARAILAANLLSSTLLFGQVILTRTVCVACTQCTVECRNGYPPSQCSFSIPTFRIKFLLLVIIIIHAGSVLSNTLQEKCLYDATHELQYLDMVVKESLRLYSPAFM